MIFACEIHFRRAFPCVWFCLVRLLRFFTLWNHEGVFLLCEEGKNRDLGPQFLDVVWKDAPSKTGKNCDFFYLCVAPCSLHGQKKHILVSESFVEKKYLKGRAVAPWKKMVFRVKVGFKKLLYALPLLRTFS